MNRTRQWLLRVPTYLLTMALGGGCALQPETLPADDAAMYAPVFLVDTEQLEPPAVGVAAAFTPTTLHEIEQDDPVAVRAAGFFLTFATAAPESLTLRMVDRESGTETVLTAIGPPESDAERLLAAQPRAFNDASCSILRGGGGCYWPTDSGAVDASAYRVGVLIPEESLVSGVQLEAFTLQAGDGTPVGAASIELVSGFFYLAVIGDSVQWGNGLREEDKMSALVATTVQSETGRRVIQQRYAHSGAKILSAEGDGICEVNCNGEVPHVRTSILVQAQQIERPDLIDLVLMDGCINDVGVWTILDPFVPEEELAELTRQYCADEMAVLLEEVHAIAPQARIVVTGYFQIVGPDSDLFALETWLETQTLAESESSEPSDETDNAADEADSEVSEPADDDASVAAAEDEAEAVENVEALIDVFTSRSVVFHETAHTALASAVEAANTAIGSDPVIAFADPGFGPENAVFAPDPWLWSLTEDDTVFEGLDVGLALFPEDPITRYRLTACFDTDAIGDLIGCIFQSVGHPNPAGARAYADAILEQLLQLGLLPEPPDTP